MSLIRKQTLRSVATTSSHLFHYQKFIVLLLAATLILLLSRVYFSNQLAVSGSRVGYFDSKLEDLQQEKYDLENELSQKGSLSYIETQAKKMGLVSMGKVQIVRDAASVAFNQ